MRVACFRHWKDCQGVLNGLERVYPPASELASRIESTYIELKDVAQEVTDREEETEFSPERLDEVNNRLNLIYSLEQKHHVDTVEALLLWPKIIRPVLLP